MKAPITTFNDVLPNSLAALARGGIAASQAKLAPPVRLFHQELLRIFLQTGRPPVIKQLLAPAERLRLDLRDAMTLLAEADLVHVDWDTQRVVVAYPMSGRRSPHWVVMSNGTVVTAMCAIDALGIPIMARADGIAHSTDPVTSQRIRVVYDSAVWTWEPRTAVVVLAGTECQGPIAEACKSTAFFAAPELAETYLAQRPTYVGRVLSQDEAVRVAETEFGPLLAAWEQNPGR